MEVEPEPVWSTSLISININTTGLLSRVPSRSVAFLSRLLEAGVDVRFADLPLIEGATGKFLLQQMAAVAELEAGMISARTKAALAAAKRRGVKLGGDRGARLTAKARAAGRAALQARARNRALDLAPTIQELQAAGCESLRVIAAGLEERGIPAPRGGKWSAVQVARLLEAAAVPFGASVRAAEPPIDSGASSGLGRDRSPNA
jgi:DNA invertase Pin-like site-specific DNA recombinase